MIWTPEMVLQSQGQRPRRERLAEKPSEWHNHCQCFPSLTNFKVIWTDALNLNEIESYFAFWQVTLSGIRTNTMQWGDFIWENVFPSFLSFFLPSLLPFFTFILPSSFLSLLLFFLSFLPFLISFFPSFLPFSLFSSFLPGGRKEPLDRFLTLTSGFNTTQGDKQRLAFRTS